VTVRVRFAPAPSGDLHLGNVRTALFNWLFARHERGTFVLRVEDTDPGKAKPELIGSIYEAMHWIGLDWDEGPDVGGAHGPYRQSERGDIYRRAIERLQAEGKVYRCYCTREEILARGTPTGYDRHCRNLSDEERERFEAEGRPYALRFAVPEGRAVVVPDLIRGDVRTEYEDIQDFVVARSDGTATFPLANAVDDIEMAITHVIRGTDLLNVATPNTLVFEALGATPPVYAHVPLLLAPDRSRLGARHGAVGILAYRAEGFLPEAMMNYLALLGWSPPTGEELLSREQLVEQFTLDRVQSSPAVFDRDKLMWMNQEYLQRLSIDEFERHVLELRPDTPRDVLRKALELELLQTRVKTLAEVPGAIRYLHERPTIDPDAAKKWLGTEEANKTLEAVGGVLETLEPWTPDAVKDAIQRVLEELGLHRRRGPKPIFVAISGSEVALPIFQSIWIIGREESVARLRDAIS
jgi:glutamyl-tRNA synthetase